MLRGAIYSRWAELPTLGLPGAPAHPAVIILIGMTLAWEAGAGGQGDLVAVG